jgi:hypothetical protein
VATKKKGGPSKRKERKYTIEQLRAALYATIGAAARGAPRRPAGATPSPRPPPSCLLPPSRCGRAAAASTRRRSSRGAELEIARGRVASPLSAFESRVCARFGAGYCPRHFISACARVCVLTVE